MLPILIGAVCFLLFLVSLLIAFRAKARSRADVADMQAALKEADAVNMESKRLMNYSGYIRDCLEMLLRESDSAKAFERVSEVFCRALGLDRMRLVDFSVVTSDDPRADIIEVGRRGETVIATSDDTGSASDETVKVLRRHFSGDAVSTILVLPLRAGDAIWGCMIGGAQRTVRFDSAARRFIELFIHSIESYLVVKLSRERLERSHARLAQALKEVESASLAKTRFLATMSHEIRTPLNAVVGFSELLGRKTVTPAEIKECTEGITRSSQALLALINDVLDIVKLESSAVDMRQGTCDLKKLFGELDAVFRYRTTAGGIELVREIPDDMPVVRMTEARVRQVLFNLVGNAVKFTERGSVTYAARAMSDGEGTVRLELEVRDTGIGISADAQKTIFDPFVQDIQTRGGKVFEGTGLGLAIVKRLVEAAGGTIVLDSEPGRGTAFRMSFDRVAVVVENAPRGPAAADARPVLPEGLRVLMVDDVPLNLRILSLHVKNLGAGSITMFGNPREALAHLREKGADIVLTDMWMPEMSGADLAKAIRSDPALKATPVVAITADTDSGATFDTSAFNTIITKPVTAQKVRDVFLGIYGGKGVPQ